MARNSQTKLSKMELSRLKKRDELNNKKKQNDASDSESSDDESESDIDENAAHNYRKLLSTLFPSKYIDKKIKAGEKLQKAKEKEASSKKKICKKNTTIELSDDEDEESGWETNSDDDEPVIKKSNKCKKHRACKKSTKNELFESDDDEDDISLGECDTDEDDIKRGNKVNITFTINGSDDYEDEDSSSDYEDYDEEEEDEDEEDEDEEVSSDEDDESDESDEEPSKKVSKKSSKPNNEGELIAELKTEAVLSQLKEILSKNPKDKSVQKCVEVYEQDIKTQNARLKKKELKQKDKNMRIFKKIITDKNGMNDLSYYQKLELEHQKCLIKELREINKITRIEKPYKMTLIESAIPIEFKAAAMRKVNSLKHMEPGSGEFYKIKNWVDTFMRIPFTKHDELPISIADGVDKCHDFMETAKNTLDQAVYGLNDAKMQIMQMLGQLLTNPKAIGTAIAIHGPPGTGKTSLVKEGISKILNRPFAFIALGGATDSSFLEGHGYTYEGSTWGKIVQILIDSKCMNPVIYFDELDKISDTPRGEEIAGILTHLTDTTQNSQFHDKYFAEINFDLSKCLFIFSYNDETKVNSILKDRMYRIKTKGYSCKEKLVISNNYLLPKIREQVKFDEGDIIIPPDVIGYIIDAHCNKEDGVRNLKRCLEIIYTKLNLYRLMKPGSNLFEGEMSLKVEFPFTVTRDIINKLIKKETDSYSALSSMYI